MTREEKSNLLNELLEYEENNDIGNLTRAERREFQQWISEALEQEPCEDAISRRAALDIYDDYNVAVENGELEAYRKYRKRLLKLPSARHTKTEIKAESKKTDADRQEKSYGVYEVYTWDDVTYELIEKYETRAEAEARAAEEKRKKREKFKPSESMPVSPFSYTVLSDTEYKNLMNNA